MKKQPSQPIPVHRFKERMEEIRVARKYEKKLRSAFKGIYSYPVRKKLLEVRDKNA